MVRLKKEYIVLMLLVCILAAPLVAATETRITVSTYANHEVEVKILNPYKEDDNFIESFKNDTGSDGEITFTHISSRSVISIAVIVRKDGKIKKINGQSVYIVEDHDAGSPRFIELIEGVGVPATTNDTNTTINDTNSTDTNSTVNNTDVNETTVENTTVTPEPETQESTGLAGQAIDEDADGVGISGKSIWFILLIAAAAALIAFFIFKGNVFKKGPEHFKVRKYSEIKEALAGKEEGTGEESIPPDTASKELLDAERKIREAQEEIRMIKNRKSKIEEAKKRLKEAREEVERLEKEAD
jgi:hypothetical protein